MKQGNGSDLLGASDPRSSTIGIIYVAPNDSREDVLTAILTQEKLGRKQVAIVLPNQNKAFQRPEDFDGLKNIRRKLQANLVIVAPHGSSPAEFSRQRRFTFFTSLESYRKSLQAENASPTPAKGGLWPLAFRGRQSRLQPMNDNVANDSMLPPPIPIPVDAQHREAPPVDDAEDRTDKLSADHYAGAAAIGLGAGAAAIAADQAMHTPGVEDHPSPTFSPRHAADDDDLALSAPAPSPELVASSLAPDVPPQDELGAAPTSQVHAEAAAGPNIIELSPHRGKATGKLSAPPAEPELEEGAEPAVVPAPILAGRRNSGKTPATGAAAMGLGAGMVARNVNVGAVPPGGGNASSGRRSRWQLLALAAVFLLLLSLLLCGTLALAAPATLGAFGNAVSHVLPGAPPSATVTITPQSVDLHNTYVITGITTGTPDSAKRQVQARVLSSTTQPQSKTVPATGVVNTPGTRASGSLTFYNGSTSPYGVSANTVFTAPGGVQIANDVLAYIPAGSPASGYGKVTVSAHAVTVGASGNIPAYDFANVQCCGNSAVFVSNTVAFSGGQDPQKYTAVQQSDVDGAANPLKGPLTQLALASVKTQVHAGENFVKQPVCTTSVNSVPPVGAKATSVTVTVTAKCTGEVYDQSGAQTIATNLLKSEAAKSAGPDYALVGNIATTVSSATTDSKGTVTLFVKAEGIWVFQFSDALKAHLASLIAGKAKKDARTLLLQQPGVAKVDSIDISGLDGSTLPTDASQITIVVQLVPGLPGTATPTGSPPSTGSPVPGSSSTSEPGKG